MGGGAYANLSSKNKNGKKLSNTVGYPKPGPSIAIQNYPYWFALFFLIFGHYLQTRPARGNGF